MKKFNLVLFKFKNDKIIGNNWEVNLDGEIVIAGDEIYSKNERFWFNIEYKFNGGWCEIGSSDFVDEVLDYLVKIGFEINNKFVIQELNKKIKKFVKSIDN